MLEKPRLIIPSTCSRLVGGLHYIVELEFKLTGIMEILTGSGGYFKFPSETPRSF